ncbi:MAG: hypothetical protein PHG15_03665 [Acinetobacter sp.]|uniref:hypothetical protein n=1 Tax=Acinetobacter sp. TaxID=472 RepID=UPI00263376FF|nr:hypothetical protein [Acinetobacter sp.]MDD2944909.1 hypothetical protein [Acinetobacter sp.]
MSNANLVHLVQQILAAEMEFELGYEEELQMVSWPFSRKLITAVCENNGIELKREGICKRFEKFTTTGVKFNKTIDNIIKLINAEARELEGSLYKNRNIVTDGLLKDLYGDNVSEVRFKAKAGTTSKKAKAITEEVTEEDNIENGEVTFKIETVEGQEENKLSVIESLESLTEDEIAALDKSDVDDRLMTTSLDPMNVKPLRAIARHYEIKGAWKATKSSLIEALIDVRETNSL